MSGLTTTNALTTNGAGMGTGIDVQAMVTQQMTALRQPEQLLKDQQTKLSQQSQILSALNQGLQDLQKTVQAFTDISGTFNAKTASTSNSAIVSATASATATPAVHTVVVSRLATTSSYASGALANEDTTFTEGTVSIKVGSNSAVDITVDSSNNTLSGLAAAINNAGLGVTASVITDANGARLGLVSQTSGAAGDITVTGNTTGLTLTKGSTGVNATLTVDGISVESGSNSISTVIPGLNLNLAGADSNQTITVTVKPDVTSMNTAVHSFVDSYNTMIKAINNQFTYDPENGASVLAGDSNLQLLQQQLLTDVSYAISDNNGVVNLQSLGVNMANDGTLTVNDSKLNNILSSQYADVQNFFQGVGSFGHNFNTNLYQLTSPLTGVLNVELTGIKATQTSLTRQVEDFEARLATQQTRLLDEYSKINIILQQLPITLSQLSAQIGSLKG